jgi:hypothetical protein
MYITLLFSHVCVCVHVRTSVCRLQISWTYLINPSRNFVEVRNYLFFEVPPLKSDALLTTLHPLLENVLQTVDHFEISCLGAPFSWLAKPRNHMGRDLNWILSSAAEKWIGGISLKHLPYSFLSLPRSVQVNTSTLPWNKLSQSPFKSLPIHLPLWPPDLNSVDCLCSWKRLVKKNSL